VPRGQLWAAWYRRIKGNSDIWARFPFLSKEALETEVSTGESQEVVDPRSMLIDI
jgi:hypothetical protein